MYVSNNNFSLTRTGGVAQVIRVPALQRQRPASNLSPRKRGRKEERNEGRKEGRKERRKGGREEGRKKGRKERKKKRRWSNGHGATLQHQSNQS
jgi:flagellar biosynthesis/type III secretory pathway protein FliH